MYAPYPSSGIDMFPSKFGRRRQPINRDMIVGILCILSLGCGYAEEQRRGNKVKEAAQAFLEKMNTSPSAEDKTTWGLNQLSLFGPPLLWKELIESNTLVDSTSYWATAAVWYRGTRPEGQSIQEQRSIVMHVNLEDGSNWRVTSYTLSEATPLSFWKQLGCWFLWSYLGPLFWLFFTGQWSFLWHFFTEQWSLLWQSEPLVALLHILFFIGAVIWSGVVSYYSFGSGLAVVACILIFVFINPFLIGLLRARKRR